MSAILDWRPEPAGLKAANLDQRPRALGELNCRRSIAVACMRRRSRGFYLVAVIGDSATTLRDHQIDEQTSRRSNVSDALSVGNQLSSLTSFSGGGWIDPSALKRFMSMIFLRLPTQS